MSQEEESLRQVRERIAREVREDMEELLSQTPQAREIAAGWVRQGADRDLLLYLLDRFLGELNKRCEESAYASIRKDQITAAEHLDNAASALRRGIQDPFVAEHVSIGFIDMLLQEIQELKEKILLGGSEPRASHRPDERQVTRYMFILSEHLRELTGRPHWREIAEFVNSILPDMEMNEDRLSSRCRQYRTHEPDALAKGLEESMRRWGRSSMSH